MLARWLHVHGDWPQRDQADGDSVLDGVGWTQQSSRTLDHVKTSRSALDLDLLRSTLRVEHVAAYGVNY